jgi:hypothetical protein
MINHPMMKSNIIKSCADFVDPGKEQDVLRKMKELRLLRRPGFARINFTYSQ